MLADHYSCLFFKFTSTEKFHGVLPLLLLFKFTLSLSKIHMFINCTEVLVLNQVDRYIEVEKMGILVGLVDGVCFCVSTMWDLQEMRYSAIFNDLSSLAMTIIMGALSCFIDGRTW